ncbi:MAG: hypothetical protein WCK77_20120 [Verrucomicrobiota bacterium]
MRYVDIDQLQLPRGWQARANTALNALRNEIQQAEAAARAAGKDAKGIAKARKDAISAGLDTTTGRQKIWGDLAVPLRALSKEKCWYSESRNPASDKNVDHFRPKNRVQEDPDHEGYWWLAFEKNNYRLSSQWCNQRRNDKVSKTSGGKSDHFPLRPGSFRACLEADDCEQEEIELLDPIDPEDWKLLTFRPDGHPTPARPAGTPEHDRAETTIVVYHLHCKELVDERRPLAGRIQRLVQNMERLLPRIADLKMRVLYKEEQKELLRAIHKDAEYSAAALAYAKSEIYTTRSGHQVKRDWLEEILNSHQ